MELTGEQRQENIECLRAYFNGEREFEYWHDGAWRKTEGPNRACDRPYRRKPKPVAVPWDCKEDVPLNCWLRWKPEHGGSKEMLIHMVSAQGVFVATDSVIPWKELGYYEYSTDRKTWLPCQKLKP
jgi:hypothetical protein